MAPNAIICCRVPCTIPGMATTTGYAAIAMYGEGYKPDSLTDGFVHCLLASQDADGRWREGGARPPLSPSSPIPATALGARVLKLYGIPAFARDLTAGMARARAYLLSSKPVEVDDYAYRLLGLFWTEAKMEQIAAAARELGRSSGRMGDGRRLQTCNRTRMQPGWRCRRWGSRTQIPLTQQPTVAASII